MQIPKIEKRCFFAESPFFSKLFCGATSTVPTNLEAVDMERDVRVGLRHEIPKRQSKAGGFTFCMPVVSAVVEEIQLLVSTSFPLEIFKKRSTRGKMDAVKTHVREPGFSKLARLTFQI